MTKPIMDLQHHRRRVGYIEWHPTAENILLSAGFDNLEGPCHQGSKAFKAVFLGDTGRVFTSGFSKFSDRQWAVWSQTKLLVSLPPSIPKWFSSARPWLHAQERTRCDACEVFRFYKLHATKGLCEPVSMIVPRKTGAGAQTNKPVLLQPGEAVFVDS
ncbi:coronin-1C-A-like [Tachypleus tridentatus]|uniref:coronin-1C-A-like n=1 Tax=Tachypleus tridentatus TaxID=6853 RepID=UPI003FD015C0